MGIVNEIMSFNNKKIIPEIINDWEIKEIVKCLVDSILNNVDGDVVEMGSFVGESSKYLMKTLEILNSNKKLYLYDSFEGLPELSEWENKDSWHKGQFKVDVELLKLNFTQNDLPLPIITKTWFKDIREEQLPNKICFAFLDGDFYESIYDSLNKIYDKVSPGGYICFHDFEKWDLLGVKSAIDDFFNERNLIYEITKPCDLVGIYKKNI